jgi:hypothetical protein
LGRVIWDREFLRNAVHEPTRPDCAFPSLSTSPVSLRALFVLIRTGPSFVSFQNISNKFQDSVLFDDWILINHAFSSFNHPRFHFSDTNQINVACRQSSLNTRFRERHIKTQHPSISRHGLLVHWRTKMWSSSCDRHEEINEMTLQNDVKSKRKVT